MGCGKSFFVFLDSQNKLYGCGSNQPTVFTGLSERIEKITLGYNDIADFAAGWKHLAVCLLDNTLKCYGSNTLGQLGHD
jgi:alpha-tubulin suppressor-like RCC1 family protein